MAALRRWLLRLVNVVRTNCAEAELTGEVSSHPRRALRIDPTEALRAEL